MFASSSPLVPHRELTGQHYPLVHVEHEFGGLGAGPVRRTESDLSSSLEARQKSSCFTSFLQGSLTAGFLVASVVIILLFARSRLLVHEANDAVEFGSGGLAITGAEPPFLGPASAGESWEYWKVCS